jgi:signaling intermediate in Toll pathway protein
MSDQSDLIPEPSVHEQEDGTILACCATGTSSKDSLLSWIRLLEKEIPNMNHLQILFNLKQAWSPVMPISKEDLTMKPI